LYAIEPRCFPVGYHREGEAHLPEINKWRSAFWKNGGVASFQRPFDSRGLHQTVYEMPQTFARMADEKFSLFINSRKINFFEW
jgi:hypothetical protein